jgi:hypothetical protein
MKRIRVFGLALALAAGWESQTIAAGPPPERTTLMSKLFGPSKPKPDGPTVRGPQRPLTISTPLPPEQLAEALRAEQDAYLRRVSVCDELRWIATQRHDEALAREADELERKFSALYNARVAALGVARTKAPLPEPSIASRDPVDDQLPIGQTASAKIAARQLEAPPAPVPGTTTAQVREVKP